MIINGKEIAYQKQLLLLERMKGHCVRLDVVLVGNYAPSLVYVQKKKDMCAQLGIESSIHHLSESSTTQDVILKLTELNQNKNVHAILVQLPLPDHIDRYKVIESIHPLKDVDGLTSKNLGLLMLGKPNIIPCTPLGCLTLLQTVLPKDLSGLHAVIIGRSELVGKPLGQLLLNHNATVTYTHSKTKDLISIAKTADILIAAIGKPKFIHAEFVKNGAVVLDVGISKDQDGNIVGDVDFDSVFPIVKAITPVPGGVGPMTVISLMENAIKCSYAASAPISED